MSGPYVLLQYGTDPFRARFEDLEGRAAFTVLIYLPRQVERTPNLVLKLIREPEWAQLQPEIMGPSASFFYFGPALSSGYIVYGNSSHNPMANSLRQKKDTSTSRYFNSQGGKEYKWKIGGQRMECLDGRVSFAVWERSAPGDEFYARLTIKHPGIAIVTEILTTLTLNRMAHFLDW
ncbi:hypothetical protein PLICRDRAFT_96541 [Plicaturopsis crispa FD-325 SS-3]|nr:hypothetical protein PLICRDRAFT_96541 [Plicaturopsis crispa FD-325 SS-3]